MFYVYLHSRADDGHVFYVGKGQGNRAWSKAPRSRWWNSVVKKHGFTVSIFKSDLSEGEALKIETDLIFLFLNEGCPMVNMTIGGKGCSGLVRPKEYREAAKDRAIAQHSDPARKKAHVEAIRESMKRPEVRAKVSAKVKAALALHDRGMIGARRLQRLHADPEMKNRMQALIRARMCKPFKCLPDDRFFDCSADAAAYLKSLGYEKAHANRISACLRGVGKTAYDRTWKFIGG